MPNIISQAVRRTIAPAGQYTLFRTFTGGPAAVETAPVGVVPYDASNRGQVKMHIEVDLVAPATSVDIEVYTRRPGGTEFAFYLPSITFWLFSYFVTDNRTWIIDSHGDDIYPIVTNVRGGGGTATVNFYMATV